MYNVSSPTDEVRSAIREIVNLELEAKNHRRDGEIIAAFECRIRAANIRFSLRLRGLPTLKAA